MPIYRVDQTLCALKPKLQFTLDEVKKYKPAH